MALSQYYRFYALIAMVVGPLFVSGCDKSALPTPVTIRFRPSLVGMGQVAVISNNSAHHLYNVRVVGRSVSELSSGSVKAADHLAPGDTVDVGWLEFGAWVPQPGETIEVYADDYLTPKVAIVPGR